MRITGRWPARSASLAQPWEAATSEQAAAEQVMKRAEVDGKAVLDPLPALEAILDRRTLRSRLPDLLERTSGRVAWSECLVVQDRRAAEALCGVMRNMLKGCDGLLCKPCVACGLPESHEMCLVRHAAALPPNVRHHPALSLPSLLTLSGLRPLRTAAVTPAVWAASALSMPGFSILVAHGGHVLLCCSGGSLQTAECASAALEPDAVVSAQPSGQQCTCERVARCAGGARWRDWWASIDWGGVHADACVPVRR